MSVESQPEHVHQLDNVGKLKLNHSTSLVDTPCVFYMLFLFDLLFSPTASKPVLDYLKQKIDLESSKWQETFLV